ncbi:MAG: hypothetical protein HYV60_20695 [Planctomycetia bacterium]|nr:hypothetical protein [Planctomycetia bacterium]
MNTLKNTRRCFLLSVPFAWLLGFWRRSPANGSELPSPGALVAALTSDEQIHKRYFSQPLDEWLYDFRLELPSLAHVLAGFERNGVEHENPATWYRENYVGVIPWRPGVSLVYAFGRQSEARSSFDNASTWLDEHHVPTITAAWSDDKRAWTRFVLADREALTPLVSKSLAPLSRCGSKTPRIANASSLTTLGSRP